jgi:acetyl-CoA carboxylase carboxyltransferase component
MEGGPSKSVGEIFSAELNPDRKRPFDIRSIMRALVDHDHNVLERWAGYGEGVVTWEARIGGMASCVIGIESHNLPRPDAPADGPAVWSSGTLFPHGAKKVARAINSASGRRPVVVLANLAGFDGSPASLRELQLEYGAEIGRAVVNCQSRIVFCVTTRYHGGAFVVFSRYLNDRMAVIAIEGAKASVIGGTPAAAVVLAAEVRRRALDDPDVKELERRLDSVAGTEVRNEVRRTLDLARSEAYQRHLSAVAAEFDATHSIERAVAVGSVDEVIAAQDLRPRIADLLSRSERA